MNTLKRKEKSKLTIQKLKLKLQFIKCICQSHSADHKAEEGTKQKKEEIQK